MAEKNLLSTFGDFLVEIGRGISNTTEGIIDAHIAPVAWVGGFFDEDFKKRASETIAYNWTDDHIKKWGWDKVREKSYASTWSGGGETARGIAEGVGAMLPSLALSAIPYAGPALSQASMSMGAGGKNMEQAINEGANFDNAFLYGIVSGSLEAGIERLGGHVMGGGSSIIGKKLAGTSLGKFTSTSVGKMLEVGVSEAGEELISAYTDPLVKAGTGVDTDIAGNYAEAVQNTGKTIATGAGVSMIIHGGGTGIRNISNTRSKRGGAKATRADNYYTSFTELGENYSADEKQNAKTLKAQNEYLRGMSQEIQSMDKTSRENYLKTSPLKQVFDAEDGTLKLDLVRENTNNEAVSSSIKAYSGTFEHAPVTNEEVIGEGARATKGYIEQILGKNARVIITSEYDGKTNASFSISEGVFYVNNNATELSKGQVAKQVAIHEIVHYTEGTKYYDKLNEELWKIALDENAPEAVKAKIGDMQKRSDSLWEDYKNQLKGKTSAEKRALIESERNAYLVQDLISEQYVIDRLAQKNEGLVKKLLAKIKALANKSAKVDSEATKYLNKLVKSFEKAIDNAHGGVSLNSIGNADEEETEGVNVRYSKSNEKSSIRMQLKNSAEILNDMQPVAIVDVKNMSKKEAFDFAMEEFKKFGYQVERQNFGKIEISKKEINDSLNYLNQESEILALLTVPKVLKRGILIDGHDNHKGRNYETVTIAAPVVINGARGNVGVVVKKGGKNKYKTHRILMPDGSEFVFETKKDTEPTSAGVKGEIHRQGPAISSVSNNSIPENGENVKSDERKSVQRSYNPSNEVDSEGSSLSEAQAEFFKDSKVRDENGNLLVVYHGSQAQFTEFKHKYINLHGSQEGRGFYFTDKKSMAQGYERKGGQLLKGYLNITKPLSDTEFTLTRAEIKKLLKALDPTGDDIVINYDTEGGMGYPSQAWYNRAFNDALNAIMNYCDTDSEVLAEIRNSGADEETLLNTVREVLGYDGYMVSDKYEGASVFVAFESNQFKNADNKAPTLNPDIRYSKKRSYTPEQQVEKYQKELDNWDRETTGFSFVIGEATEIISNIEIDGSKIGNKQIRIDATKVKKILSEHNTMSIEVIKELPYLINDPILIMDSLTQKGRIILLGDVYDEAGMPVMLILEPNPKTKNKKSTYANVIKVASAYGKGKLQSLIERSNIRYISKNKSRANNWLKVNRLQLPLPNTQHGSAINSIDQNSEKINSFDENNLNERKSKKRSYNPAEDADVDDEGNIWVEDEQDGVRIIFSTPDFSNPNYEKNHAPGYRLSDTYDGDNPEAYVIEGKQNILSENSKLKKFVADNIRLKKYSRKDASNILFEIMTERGYFDGINTKFKGKSKAEIERMLWDALNVKVGGQKGGAALDIADAIITNLLVTEQYEMTPELELAYQVVNYLKTHLHNINLDHIKGDIKVKYDKNNSPFALWARKEGTRGVTADQIKEEIEVEIPGIRISATTEADIFLEIDELYRDAREIIKESTPEKTTLMGIMDSSEIKSLRQKIAKDILRAYDNYGSETRFSKLEKKYIDRLARLSGQLYDAKRMNTLENRVLKEVRKIVDNKNGKYANATQVQTDALKNIKSLLGRINSREQINRTSTRDIMQAFAEWYKKDNPVLEGFYLEEMAEIVNYFSTSQGKAKLTYSELDIIHTVLRHMNFVFENYGKIWKAGKYVDAKEVATSYMQTMKEALDSQSAIEKLLFKNKATRFFMDPTAVASQYDGHDENGFFTQTLKEFQEGLIMQRYYEMVALEEFKEFTEKKHKKYFKELLKGKRKINVGAEIDIRGLEVKTVEVPVYYAMELYMVSKTGEAIQTLEETGWMLKLDNSDEQKKMGKLTKEQIEAIYNQFTAEDKQLVTIMEKAYNGICRELKLDTDMKRLGFSNVFDGYYYPIHRFTATEFDSNDFFVEMERVSKVGFNNNRVKGAKQALLVGNVFSTFIRHVNAVTRYSALSIPISNMKMVYNMDIGENANMPESIKMQVLTNKMWDGAQDYLQKLADDVQQIGVKPDEGSRVFAYLRGAYAKSALGANPKVWFSQLSSYLAAYGELRFSSLVKASTIKGFIKDSDVDKYCKLAAVRHYERGATRAMTVTDKVGKVGEILTAPIEAVDRQVVKMLFAACQAEVKSRYKLDIGTEENKIKAGELLKDVILKSQQNQLVTEQSGAMRSTSEFIRSFTMFNADSMKLLSRFIEYVGKTATLKKKMKSAQAKGDTELYNKLSSEHKSAVKHLCKYSASIVSIAVYMSLVAKLFKWLYNKDDEDEGSWDNFGKDIAGNIIGMVPIVRDIYSYFEDGYDVDNYAFSMMNDLLKAVDNTKNAFTQLVSGQEVSSQRWASSIRSLIYSISQFMGIPTRNAYNFATGIIRRVDEGTGLKIDSAFYAPSSTTLKEKYLEGKEKGNNSLVSASLDLMYKNRDIEITDAVLKREMDRLVEKNLTKERDDNANYSPFGSQIPDTVTFEGEEIELTSKQKNGFKTAYNTAQTYSAKIVKTAMYKGLDDESKAYALRKVYEYYHKSALEDVTGEKAKLVYFGSFIGIDKLALIIAYAKNVKGDSSGTRKEKIELYIKKFGLTKSQASLALRYLGYTDKEMDSQVQNLIKARGSLTKEQKEEFLGYI